MNCKCNKLIIGLIVGLVVPVLMSVLLYHSLYHGEKTYWPFLHELVRMGNIGKLLSISVLPNLIIFFIAVNKERLLAARGIVTATLVYAVVVIIFKFML
ncbi:hypothetical protein [Carboxylicivirga linearis]|uniref:DUF1648 domain-containing protein n=1 Tax=Carboxylicivirga linearis TaxID=1628157 RepID=A0ABS5JUM7_9BACT|nr:hypothetical protein [Carboxylicivirga linearis]MBS2098613.1 hypothetical protein [Carboxylicivirga linearis]